MIEMKEVSFAYGKEEKPSLHSISLSVKEGEFLLVCGETGCGKSTLLRLLKPEVTPQNGVRSGEILYCGEEIRSSTKKTASEIGYVMQRPEQQIVTDRVWHELAFGLENLNWSQQEIRRRTAEMAAYFDMESWFMQETDTLSGGQKQQLVLASVLAMGTKVLLLDEPTAQLDPIASTYFFATLERLQRELGLTVILAEHRLEEVFAYADHVLYLHKGEMSAYGTPSEVAASLLSSQNAFSGALPVSAQIAWKTAFAFADQLPLSVRSGRLLLHSYSSEERRNFQKLWEKEAAKPVDAFQTERIKKWETLSEAQKKREAAVYLSEVFFSYENTKQDVLRGVTLSVMPQECMVIVGGNASGKSTLLRVIAGILQASLGEFLIFAKRQERKQKKKYKTDNIQQTALLMQDVRTQFTEESVWEELQASFYFGVSDEKKESAKEELLEKVRSFGFVGLMDQLERHPYDLSGGEQQMLGLAKVLLRDPRILLLDEPTRGLDCAAREQVCEILKKQRQAGKTILVVTHDLEFAGMCADRVAMLFSGEVVSCEEAREFFQHNLFYTTYEERLWK